MSLLGIYKCIKGAYWAYINLGYKLIRLSQVYKVSSPGLTLGNNIRKPLKAFNLGIFSYIK